MHHPSLEGYARYALFWAPTPGTALAREGAVWLGWDPAAGEAIARQTDAAPAREADPRVAAPRRYGLHATLKAPFRLAESVSAADLDAALAAFARDRPSATGPALAILDDLGFFALRPSAPCPAVDALAADVVRDFDRFRAPLTDEDRARRGVERLGAAERALLEAWGYPHVLDRFRFHVTLTGRLAPEETAATRAELVERFAPLLAPGFALDAISLFGDPGGGAGFRHLRRYPLTG